MILIFDTQQMETRLISDTQQIIGDAIILNRQGHDQYLILSKLAKGASGSAGRIHSILKEWLETCSLLDTQQIVGDMIDIQYCLIEGKRLGDGHINQ